MALQSWNMITGFKQKSLHETVDEWEYFYNSKRLSCHYDMFEEKWFFYEKTEDGSIYQLSFYDHI